MLRSLVRLAFVRSLFVRSFLLSSSLPQEKPALAVAWTGYKMAGPILSAEDHRGTLKDKPFRLFFTDVGVKLAGTNDFVAAK